MLLSCCLSRRSYRSPILCNQCVMYVWKFEKEICVIKKWAFLLVGIVIKPKSTELQISLKQITDSLNIGFKETCYPLLQIHHIDLPKKGNDWVYFEQNTSLRGLQSGLFILWPESDDAAWLVLSVHLSFVISEKLFPSSLDYTLQSALNTGNWCAINLVIAYTEYVPTVLTVWICSVWLLGLYFFIKTVG
jgi:hypothetical protein